MVSLESVCRQNAVTYVREEVDVFILYLLEALTVVATGVYAIRSMLSEDRETVYAEREYLANQLHSERARCSELVNQVEASREKLFEHNCKIFDLIQFNKPPTEEECAEEEDIEEYLGRRCRPHEEDEVAPEEDYVERKDIREKKIIHQTQKIYEGDGQAPGNSYE